MTLTKKLTKVSLIAAFIFVTFLSLISFAATAPEITYSQAGGNIAPGGKITVSVTLPSGTTLRKIGYMWGEYDYNKLTFSTSNPTTITAPTTEGTYELHVYAQDSNGTFSNGNGHGNFVCYTFNVTSGANPTIAVTPNGGQVITGSDIRVVASVASGTTLDRIVYRWDSDTAVTVTSSPVTVKAPTTTGAHTLKVIAYDKNGKYSSQDQGTINFTVVAGSTPTDLAAPTVSVSPKAGSVSAGSTIVATATVDSRTTLNYIAYRWDNDAVTTSTTSPVRITVPATAGSHTLRVIAYDNNGKNSSAADGIISYTVTSGSAPVQAGAPTVSVSPKAGSVNVGSTIVATATVDPSTTLNYMAYRWDNGAVTTSATSPVNITVPSTTGTHVLRVIAYDNNGKNSSAADGIISYTVTSGSTPTDLAAPTISISPNGGTVNIGSIIVATATVDPRTTLNYIAYRWDNGAITTSTTSPVSIAVPSTTGTHTLRVIAYDNNGKSSPETQGTISFNITSPSSVTAPKVYVTPNGGDVVVGRNLVATATVDPSTTLNYMAYRWDNGAITTSATSPVNIAVPTTVGTHTLRVIAYDKLGQFSTQAEGTIVYNVISNTTYTKPVITLSPNGGTIKKNSNVKISVDTDGVGLKQLAYAWDSTNNPTYVTKSTVSVPAPKTAGDHYLYVYAIDNNNTYSEGNHGTWYRQLFTIKNSSYNINPGIRTLAISLLNTEDVIEHPIEKPVLYEIVYYNGTSSDIENATVTFKLPTNFSVTNYYGGTLENDTTVVWDIDLIGSKESGSVYIEIQCDSLNVNEKAYTFTASIYKKSGTTYKSQLRNLFYKPDTAGKHVEFLPDDYVTNFYPSKGLSRVDFAIMIVKALELNPNDYDVYSLNYTDVDFFTEDANYIAAATSEGYFEGYPDNSFRPEGVITRAEIATVLSRIFGIAQQTPMWINFEDTDGHWAQDVIEKLYLEGLVEGYEDGYFKPDKSVSRAEGVTLLNRFLFRGELITEKETFKDVTESHWAHGNVEEAAKTHYYIRLEDGNEEPVSSSYYRNNY